MRATDPANRIRLLRSITNALAPRLHKDFEVGDRVVGASALSPSDAAGQEAVVGSAQRVVVTRARALRDTAVQHSLEFFGFQHPDLELEGGARSVVQFEGICPEVAPGVAYGPVDLDGQVGVVIDNPPEVNEIVCLFVYLAGSLEAECGGTHHYLAGERSKTRYVFRTLATF